MHLLVQWIHSNKTYHADFLTKIQEKINSEQSEKNRLEQLLEMVREPHGLLKYLDPGTLSALPKEEEMRPAASILVASMIPPVGIDVIQFADPINDFFSGLNLYWTCLILCGILSGSYRFDLLNISLGVAGLCCEVLLSRKEVISKIKPLLLFLIGACVHDFIWFIIYGAVFFHK